MSKTNNIVNRTDRVAGGIRDIFVIGAMTVGLIIASLPPAIILSTALFRSLEPLIGFYAALVTGFAFAVLLETTGVVSSHVAIWQYRRSGAEDGRFQVAAFIAVAYMIAGVISIFVFDQDAIIRTAGTFAYVAALMIYVSSALASDMRHVEQQETHAVDIESQMEQQEISWQRRQKEIADEREFQLRLAQKENNKAIRLAQIKPATVVEAHATMPLDMPRMRQDKLTKKQRTFLSYLDKNRLALRNKSELSNILGISRPTIDAYLDRFGGSRLTIVNSIVQEVNLDD